MESKCVYCSVNPPGNSEHVFCAGLGGENIFMNSVCNNCNTRFSPLERELLQNSPIGFMRSVEGIEGHRRNKKRPSPLKHNEIFSVDEVDNIVYEVGSFKALKSFRRPQIIQIKGKIYIEGPDTEDIQEFADAFEKWIKENRIMVLEKKSIYKGVRFSFTQENVIYDPFESKTVKGAAFCVLLNPNSKFNSILAPRIFFDDEKRLKLRSRSHPEAIQFLMEVLQLFHAGPVNLSSYSNRQTQTINVSASFDIVKVERACVKIGLNSLLHYFPETCNDTLINIAKDFVLEGTKGVKLNFSPQQISGIDELEKIHYVAFIQMHQGLVIRIRLFKTFIFSFLIEGLVLFLGIGIHSILEIDFINKKQELYDLNSFLNKHFPPGTVDF